MTKRSNWEGRQKDLRWLNWYINRGHIGLNPTNTELRKFMSSISHRRKL